jgi:hypothetical protein
MIESSLLIFFIPHGTETPEKKALTNSNTCNQSGGKFIHHNRSAKDLLGLRSFYCPDAVCTCNALSMRCRVIAGNSIAVSVLQISHISYCVMSIYNL